MSLVAGVREHCQTVAAAAAHVRIRSVESSLDAGTAGLDPELHFLEGDPESVARYVLILDAVNFGSGWFGELGTGTDPLTRRLTEHARGRGEAWGAAELRALTPAQVGEVLCLDRDRSLTRFYAQALRELGAWLGSGSAMGRIAAAAGSADRFAAQLVAGMPLYSDPGFYKRAQITANDLVLAGVAEFADVDTLTAFADNLVPHVLRMDGVLEYAPELAARIDTGEPLAHGSREEIELRACAVVACDEIAGRLGVPPRTLDNWLWNRGQSAPYTERPAHVTYTTAY